MPELFQYPETIVIDDLERLGAAIRARRKALRLSLDEASVRLGVGRRLLLELERGERQGVAIGTVLAVLHRLGFDLTLKSRGPQR